MVGSSSMDDLLGVTEHRSFMSRIRGFLECCRKVLSSLVSIGRMMLRQIISCFNSVCSYVKNRFGCEVEPVPEMDPGSGKYGDVKVFEDGENLEKPKCLSKEEKEIAEEFRARMKTQQENLLKKLSEFHEECKGFDEHFEAEKKKSEQRIEELKRKAERERIEKDEAANQETEKLIQETREMFPRFVSTERGSVTDLEFNENLERILDNMEPDAEPETPSNETPPPNSQNGKIILEN